MVTGRPAVEISILAAANSRPTVPTFPREIGYNAEGAVQPVMISASNDAVGMMVAMVAPPES